VKLSWSDMYTPGVFSLVKDKDAMARETGLGVADRNEYYERYGENYL